MTRENAILCLKGIKNYGRDTFTEQSDWQESLDMAIKALERQPCEDAISREAVDDYIAKLMSGYLYDEERTRLEEFSAYLWELPSVTPQPKTGHWIDIMVEDMPAQACDKCKTFYPLAYTGGGHKYCPNCGAKMESEVQDANSD